MAKVARTSDVVRVTRLAVACGVALALGACRGDPAPRSPHEFVGRKPDGRTVTPVNQTLAPFGGFVDLPGLRPQAIGFSRDGAKLLVSGKTAELLVLDADDGAVLQRVAFPHDDRREASVEPVSPNIQKPDTKGQLSYTGLLIADDGKRVFLSNVRGSIKVFAFGDDGALAPSHTLPLPPANAPRRDEEIPTGLALSRDGGTLWVCGMLGNRLLELDSSTGDLRRTIEVGVAPWDVVLAGERLFVSNFGGRRPAAGDLVGPAGRGTTVRVDPVRHVASEGSVSVIDLASGAVVRETPTGLHACDLALSPDGRFVVCCNAGSDNLSVLDARDGTLVDTIWAKPSPADLLGATPNALAFAPDGERLYVANGTQNAIGVIDFDPDERGDSRLRGLIPVGWFPGALLFDAARTRVVAANVKGIGFGRERRSDGEPEFNSHQYHGSVSLCPLPDDELLERLTVQVDVGLRRDAIEHALLPPRPGVPARAIPERVGEPSLIRHVVYVIKENRTYDQVLGDLPQGRGDPELCVFGERITPNQHAIARQFVLLDNTYCAGILSADGHQWSTTAFATDYMEKSFAGFPRSYPDGMGEDEDDALAYSPAGFIWDHALARGITLRNYGEFCGPKVRWRDASRSGEPDFLACWKAWQGETDDVVFQCAPMVPPLEPHSPPHYVGWNMSVPDQYRADVFLRELAEFESRGEFPQLTIVCLPNDHTSGTDEDCPTPAACMADNDLAFGRIVEGLSRSRFWPRMAIFGIEDDPQAGWDHVSGYRTTCYVAGPYVKRGVTVGTQFNTTSVLRTIEQILGIPPMNQFDASATPMHDAFTDVADLTPFCALPANIRLDEMNPKAGSLLDAVLRDDALASASIDFSAVDRAPEDLLNRILWRAMRGTAVPYPDWAVTKVADDDD
ncbi:MAG: bifunctional YncE family protein/alkaline phosphatase family protein [Planctomycetes bacterium]|nr:bifunctional YncE family protein/alkaline phosphatase family protein [Planctomycetota bacterium]